MLICVLDILLSKAEKYIKVKSNLLYNLKITVKLKQKSAQSFLRKIQKYIYIF